MADLETIKEVIGLPDHLQILQLNPDDTVVVLMSYTALVNPESYSTNHSIHSTRTAGFDSKKSLVNLNYAMEKKLSIDFLFDSTGSLGNVPIYNQRDVLEQINYFLEVAFVDKSNQDAKPKLLKLVWGPMEFTCMLEKARIVYSRFDATGMPIRATATCVFIEATTPASVEEKSTKSKDQKSQKVDFAKRKHAVNSVLKYGSYMVIVAQQPRSAMPKTLRIAEQIAKMIF